MERASTVIAAAAAAGVEIRPVRFDASTRTAEEAAAAVGVEVGRIVKSLVFGATHDDGREEVLLALVSGPNRLDERRLAEAARVGRTHRVDAAVVRAVTGFAIGGIPPFGHATPLRTFIDEDLLGFEGDLWAAAGTPNDNFAITGDDLVAVSGGLVCALRTPPAG